MAGSVITWPSIEENQQIIADFANMGFPNVIGCIDCTHIQPATDPESYINRKKVYSIQMQTVCDSIQKLTDIFIGYPGSVHDAHIIMLTPYRNNGNLAPVERNFNNKLSGCRITIEHTLDAQAEVQAAVSFKTKQN
nr:unnamed protein product [Callosobruchus chinensis]